MRTVLDSSFFFTDRRIDGEIYTTPSVTDELIDTVSQGRLAILIAEGLVVQEPDTGAIAHVRRAAARMGDAARLSRADMDLLALAWELGAGICSDDFSVQNVAHELKLEVIPILQRKARRIRWKFRCSGCGRFSNAEGTCPVCGAQVKRKSR